MQKARKNAKLVSNCWRQYISPSVFVGNSEMIGFYGLVHCHFQTWREAEESFPFSAPSQKPFSKGWKKEKFGRKKDPFLSLSIEETTFHSLHFYRVGQALDQLRLLLLTCHCLPETIRSDQFWLKQSIEYA